MATTKLYLDTRAVRQGQEAPLKLAIMRNSKTALLSLNVSVLPSQWDKATRRVVAHPNKSFLNTYLANRKTEVDNIILKLFESGEIYGKSAMDIKRHVLSALVPEVVQKPKNLFTERLLSFAAGKKERTREVYTATYKRIVAFIGEDEAGRVTFEDMTKEWLTAFDTFLSRTSPSKNARNIHLRNIRAVFNEAIDDGITTFYPFRRFKIRPVATAKRSLTVEQLRLLFSYPVEEHARKYVDAFKLIFFLVGINVVDLCNLKGMTNGRIEYYRAKTNRLYSIKVEPEAAEIIEKYRGKGHLLDILDRYRNHRDYMKRLNENLKHVGEVTVGKQGKKTYAPLFPRISSYWARHSWATVAAGLEIPKETIAAALGHGGNTVTDIYIDFDQKKVDEANRRVMDWVLYGRR